MTEKTKAQFTTAEILRAALARGLSFGSREVSFSTDGISVTDALGGKHDLLRYGLPVSVDLAEMAELMESNGFRNWNASGRRSDQEREFTGLGVWLLGEGESEGLVLKPKKPRAPCADALAEPKDDGLSRVRSLYRRGGIDIFVLCEGDTRTKDFTLALATERNILGLPTKVKLQEEPRQRYWHSRAEHNDQFGPAVFDDGQTEAGERWEVSQVKHAYMGEFFFDKEEPEGTRVFVAATDRYQTDHFLRAQEALDQRERPAVVMVVRLDKSNPVMFTRFTKELYFDTTAEEVFADAPWSVFAERKTARMKSRKQAPKTWHPTTEAVAEAFVTREAPRGYVSGRNLYFHGPIAFSCYDQNPVAAIVDLPGKRQAIFYGRDTGIGGTMAGTVSMAQSHVIQAARGKGFVSFEVGSLTEFLMLGDRRLDEVAGAMRRNKDEVDYPSSCRIDRRKLKAYLARKHEEYLQEVDEAFRTEFATYRKATAYRSLQKLSEKRDMLAAVLGAASLPDIGVAEEYRAMADAEQDAANRRQMELRERKQQELQERRKAEAEEEREEGSSFSM